MRKKHIINTKQRPNGVWDCYTTFNGYDYSFQGKTMAEAQGKMKEFLDSLFTWADPVIHPPVKEPEPTQKLTPIVGYRKWWIDKGMV